jgi:hypothetical protein
MADRNFVIRQPKPDAMSPARMDDGKFARPIEPPVKVAIPSKGFDAIGAEHPTPKGKPEAETFPFPESKPTDAIGTNADESTGTMNPVRPMLKQQTTPFIQRDTKDCAVKPFKLR